MKTDKFEKTIRQKLESISPDFHEEDWTKMQNYMHFHTPPTFWQQYGSWIGYAAAASVSAVLAFLYVSQLTQNNNLVSDVKQLKSQIEVIKGAPAVVQKTDTVYIVQKELNNDQLSWRKRKSHSVSDPYRYSLNGRATQTSEASFQNDQLTHPDFTAPNDNPAIAEKNDDDKAPSYGNELAEKGSERNFTTDQLNKKYQEAGSDQHPLRNMNSTEAADASSAPVKAVSKTPDVNFDQLTELHAIAFKSSSRQLNYTLADRLSGKQVKRMWLATTSATPKTIAESKKAENTNQAESTIPKLNLKVPYRFGAGLQLEGHNQIKTITGEVLISKKFSLSTGISWLKVKPMEFFTEKIFRDKNRKDFKRSHPGDVPMAFEIMNIRVKPTMVQIPLTVAFRNTLHNNFTYYAGAGTSVNISGKDKYSYDCMVPYPYPKIVSQEFERKLDVPVINSLHVSAGVEKTWHPIVVQVEGYVYTYFKQLTPESPRTGPGVKLKLLYQIGGKM